MLSVIDEYQPEVHADVHGTGLQEYPEELLGDRTRYQGQMMFECRVPLTRIMRCDLVIGG